MSSEERSGRRREIVSRLYREGWGPGDFDLVRELLDDDVVWTAIAGAPDAGTYRGFETVRAYMQDWLDEFDFNEGDDSQIEDAVEVGERLVCLQRVIGTGKRSGLRTEIRYACVYTFGEDEREPGERADVRRRRRLDVVHAAHVHQLVVVGDGGIAPDVFLIPE